jgi:exodeoxyribonuclease VII small subunit
MAENKPASFEKSLARLEKIVEELQSETIELEVSVALFKEGRDLVRRCEDQLKVAEAALRAIDDDAASVPSGRQPSSSFDEDAALEDEIPF